MSGELYHIPAINFARLDKEIERLNKRAAKLETEPVVLQVHAEEHVTRTDEFWDTEYEEIYFVCSVEGPAPQIKGYTLIASIAPVEGSEDNKNLVREVPGQKCPKQFRTTDMSCDHCQVNVRRKSVFLLKNEFGEYRQVGRNCLQDYLGGADPEALLGRAEYMFSFAKVARDAEDREWGKSVERCVPINQFVITCQAVIQKLGWIPRSKAAPGELSTSDIAWSICTDPKSNRDFAREKELKVTPESHALAEDAVNWASEIKDADNNYLHDLGVCCRQQYVTKDRAGYVGSVLQAYQNSLNQQVDESNSSHFGVEGQKSVLELTVTGIRNLEAGKFGPQKLIQFLDQSGNVFNWFTGSSPKWVQIGGTVTVNATIKKHDEYKGVKQTILKLVKPI